MTRDLAELASAAGIDLASEPFTLVRGHTARRAAGNMAAAYDQLEALDEPKLAATARDLLDRYGFEDGDPVAVAAAALAEQVEAHDRAAQPNPYHNAHHILEVLLNAHYLALRNDAFATHIRLTPRDHGRLYLAALIHDLDHDGTMNGSQRFRLERQSLVHAWPILAQAGVPAEDCKAIETMVLATDPAGPNLYLKALHAHVFYDGEPPPPTLGYAELEALARDDRLLRLAGLLNDADLLSSAGFTLSYSLKQSEKLGLEGGRRLDNDDLLRFIQHIVGGSFTTRAGRFFNPNLLLIKSFAELNRGADDDGIDAPLIRP